MKSDVASYVGAVIREVDSREHEGRLARVVVATRTYDTTIEDVWDALTNAERIPRWFLPISGDLRLSGSYQLQGNARRRDHALRAAAPVCGNLGDERSGELAHRFACERSGPVARASSLSTSRMSRMNGGIGSVPVRWERAAIWP